MKPFGQLTILLFCLSSLFTPLQGLADDFSDQSLRIEIYMTGDAKSEVITIGAMVIDPQWAGPADTPVSPFDQGAYIVSFYDSADKRLLFRRCFDCQFSEYKTTDPALQGIAKTYSHSLVIPCPKRPGKLVLEQRDRMQKRHTVLERAVDPADYHIIRRSAVKETIFTLQENGESRGKVDLLYIAEGYTESEREKFQRDAERFTQTLFSIEPYSSHKNDFNIRAVFSPSPESGVDEPRKGIYRETTLDSSFNALDLDRYLLTEAGHQLRRLAGAAPYDTLVILVNSERYGGGGIFNDYSINTVDNSLSPLVFLHEFGHNFAGLADEYYSSSVAYNEFYPKGLEPLEPNITALLDPTSLKWRELLSPGVPLPTPWGKGERESLQKQIRDLYQKQPEGHKTARGDQKKIEKLRKKLKKIEAKYAYTDEIVGAFEGAGYASEGLYRPMTHCLMFSNQKFRFCRVCQHAIVKTIDYYCGRYPVK